MRKNNLFKLLGVGLSAMVLASCSNINPDLPLDYNDPVLTVTKDGEEIEVPFNYNRQYYDDIGEINATAVNTILDFIGAELSQGNIQDADGNVYHLYSSKAEESSEDTVIQYVSGINDETGAYEYGTYTYKGITNELTERAQQSMLDMVTGGSYDYNNVFDEKNFILSLNQNNLARIPTDHIEHTLNGDSPVVVNKESDFEDVFTPDIYNDYINRSLVLPIVENKLTAQYIYNERYSSIVNAGARTVSIAALTDRDDEPGSAQSLINAYYRDYLSQGKVIDTTNFSADEPLEELCYLWRGYNLSEAQQIWMTDNNLTNLYEKIDDDISKINLDNPLLTDQDLQDQYTGNNSYDLEEGRKRAVNSLLKEDIYTEGLYEKDDLSSLPEAVTDQLFATNMTSVRTEVGGHKYITPKTSSSDPLSASTITIYDSDSDTYYLAMVDDDDIYDSSTLGTKSQNEQDPEARAKAMDVAYHMNSSSTYRTDSVVYWLKAFIGDGTWTVKNQSFYDYLDSTYPDLFDDED